MKTLRRKMQSDASFFRQARVKNYNLNYPACSGSFT